MSLIPLNTPKKLSIMKNIKLILSSFLFACGVLFVACDKNEEADSTAQVVSVPEIAYKNASDAYVYGAGNTHIYTDLPDVIAVAVDSIYGFEGGYGGKTGKDSIKILKTEVLGWPDTTAIGASSLNFQKYNRGNYRVTTSVNIVIAGPIPNPGPTALEGLYKRTANGFIIEVKKVFDGVYVIDNPGGAAVGPFPYLLYNHVSSTGVDSLAFPIQGNECGGGTQLVGPTAPFDLVSSEYTAKYPPIIAATAPVTLQWRVFTFSSAKKTALQPGNGGLCTWGVPVRTFEKQ